MRNLIDALRDHDLHMLQIIANRWDIDLDVRDVAQAAIHLADAMLMPDRAENEWERLKDRERGALQMLIAAQNHKMPLSQFTRLFGEIRQMGPDGRQREKPHLSPLDVGEILYYRGFLHLAVDESKTGMQTFVYVPHDLATVLPTHQAGYDLSETPEDFPDFEPIEDSGLEHVVESETPDHVRRADTSLVDDVTTLLAYAQMHPIRLERGWVPENVQQHILEQFLGPRDYSRLLMAFSLALDLKLLDEQEGVLQIQKNSARRWLEMLRTQQVSQLTQKWHITERYNELWQIPNLAPEETGWRNDPALLRQTLLETIRFFNNEGWIGLDQLIAEIREMDPDFQRPGGDYSSWYIRDRDTGDYLQGFEQWDRVEGATLRFAVEGPMYWLGLVDLGHSTPDGPVTSFRLTAFGRAWAGMTDWPELRDPEAHIHITADGEIAVPRAISRYERFQ
ncbi:MAG: hypothetical protein GYB66_11775, partial [Chloroflexi bacterium]|nr:hypothetical protein [Chloroflexota bacterium]